MINCPQCNTVNQPNSRFCSGCGVGFVVQPQPLKRKNSISTPVLIIIGLIVLCGFCGALGSLNKDKTPTNTNAVGIASSPVPTQTPPPSFAELKTKAAELMKFSRNEYQKSDLQQFDDVMQPLRAIPKEAKEYKEAQALNKKLIDKVAPIGAEIVVLGEKPTNSTYDGRVDAVVTYLKANLNDYEDSEWLEWSPVIKTEIKGEPFWAVRLKLRAKNAFGGKILKEPVFLIRQNTVVRAVGL